MKPLNKIYLVLLIAMAPINACNTPELTALNENPNETNQMDWSYLFANSLVRMANNVTDIVDAAPMIQHMAYLQNSAGDKYFRIKGNYFATCYDYIVKDLAEVVKQTGPGGLDQQMVNLHNAARVSRVFAYHICTDRFGDVPYSEANKGYEEGIYFPKYDHQQDVYSGMLQELSEAARGFSEAEPDVYNMGIQDIIFNGDVIQWRKFAYSMMLRLAVRISNIDPATAQQYISEAIEGGVFTSNADNAFIPMETGPVKSVNSNRMSRILIPTENNYKGMLSNTFIDFLRDNNDPRLMIISSGIGFWDNPKITDPALQRGMPNGRDPDTILDYEGVTSSFLIDTTYSRVNELLLDLDDPILLQTYAEVEFLLAEAAVNNWHSADPAIHYDRGVRAAMQMFDIFDPSLTVSDAEVDAYLAAHPFDPANGLEMIGTQYWAATFLNFSETWANWRRTEIPMLIPVNYPGNHTGGTIPRRYEYNSDDAAINMENYNAAVERIGGDKMTTRVWWDGGN